VRRLALEALAYGAGLAVGLALVWAALRASAVVVGVN
jgi:hypothetical protein